MWKWLWNLTVGRAWGEFEECVKGKPCCLEKTASRNRDFEDTADEGLEGNEKLALGNCRKRNLIIEWQSLATLLPAGILN